MQCPRCQQDVRPHAQFCPEGGATLAPIRTQCGTSGHVLSVRLGLRLQLVKGNNYWCDSF